jgi:hypothetical protein
MVYSKGITNKGKYIAHIGVKETKVYTCWKKMLERCYSEKLHRIHPTYIGCAVCEEWLWFQNFAEWYFKNYIEGYELDKDILVEGNKLYSPDTCCFLSHKMNNLFHENKSKKIHNFSVGVHLQNGRFRAMSNNELKRHIGYYGTEAEAYLAYLKAKWKYVKEVISTELFIDPRLYPILQNKYSQ